MTSGYGHVKEAVPAQVFLQVAKPFFGQNGRHPDAFGSKMPVQGEEGLVLLRIRSLYANHGEAVPPQTEIPPMAGRSAKRLYLLRCTAEVFFEQRFQWCHSSVHLAHRASRLQIYKKVVSL